MYLPNPDLRPTGSEATEFLDVPPMTADDGSARPLRGAPVRLDLQTCLNIARWTEEYITGLVENHDGGPEDVRTVIHHLHDQRTRTDRDGSL